MAELLYNKLFHSSFFNSNRFQPLSFPLNLSPLPNFSTTRFISRKRRFSDASVLANLPSDSTRFDIISTTEHSDGSFVFKFGDASENSRIVENVDVSALCEAQPNGDLFEDEQKHDSISTEEVCSESETVKHEVEMNSLKTTSDSSVDVIMENSGDYSETVQNDAEIICRITTSDSSVHVIKENLGDSEIVKDDVAISSLITTSDNSLDLIMENSEEVSDKRPVAVLSNSQLDFDGNNSLEIPQNNEKLVVNEDNDVVELMLHSAQLEAQPVLDKDVSSHSVDDVAAVESASGCQMGTDTATPAITEPADDPCSSDNSIAAGPEASGIFSAETNLGSNEISVPKLFISSAAASLPHPSEALAGGEDAYFIFQNWLGVADGVGQWSFGGINRGLYAQELMQNCEKLALNSQNAGLTNIKEVLQQSAEMTQSNGSARVLIAHFANQILHVANIGDSGFVIIRNGVVFKKSSPMVHEFNFPHAIGSGVDPLDAVEEYHIELEDGDVIITATDGLFDNLYEQEIAFIVTRSLKDGLKPKEVAELLANKAQVVGRLASARSPFADGAQAAGHTGYIGGKLDNVTVILSLVHKR